MTEKVKLVVCNEPQNCGTVKELVAEVQSLKEMLDSLTGDDKLAVMNWKKLFDSYGELRDKNNEQESRLVKAQDILNEPIWDCPCVTFRDGKFTDTWGEPSDEECGDCKTWKEIKYRHRIRKALGGEKR